MLISVQPEWICKADDFAERAYETNRNKYAKRQQFNARTIKRQISDGKLVEEAVCQALAVCDFDNISQPDYEVYSSTRKSFEPDLITEDGYRLHIKGQTEESARRYGTSWMFSVEDPLLHNPTDKDIIIFAIILEGYDAVEVLGWINATTLLSLDAYTFPVLESQKESKRVVYYEGAVNFFCETFKSIEKGA